MKTVFPFFAFLFLISSLLTACSNESGSPISAGELHDRINTGQAPLILDVRSDKEFSEGHIENAMHIPLNKLQAELPKLQDKYSEEIVVYCHSGGRAKKAEDILRNAGFTQVRDLTGHYEAWKKSDLPLTKIN